MNKDLRNSKLQSLKNCKFNVIILGKYDKNEKLFSKTFPVILNESNTRHKYINRYDLCIKEHILFPKDFLNVFHPEIMDLLLKIDILILIYDKSNKISFDYLKTFYYLYYKKFEEIDKPKNIILIERNYAQGNGENNIDIIDVNEAIEFSKLLSSTFCDLNTDEELLNKILVECVDKLIAIYNYNDDYSQYKLKIFKNEINCYLLLFGDNESQNLFLKEFLKSNCEFKYKKIKDNFYEINYTKNINEKEYNFKIMLKLMAQENYYDSECNILVYNINKNESYNLIRKIIRGLIANNDSNLKKIFNLFSLNSSPTAINENEVNNRIKEGKNLAYEIGANYHILNMNNNQNLSEEIKTKFDNILNIFVDYINISNSNTPDEISNKNCSDHNRASNNNKSKDKECNENFDDFVEIINYDSPSSYLREINSKIHNLLKGNQNSLFNICKKCYSHLSIKINDDSNILIVYCENCKTEPRGLNIDQFILNNKQNINDYHCNNCSNYLNYEPQKKLYCKCEKERTSNKSKKSKKSKNNSSKSLGENISIPFFLKDSYCFNHSKFNKYYLKYSKKGLCDLCLEEKKEKLNNYESFEEEEVNKLFKMKNEELNEEFKLINLLKEKFDECIIALQTKFVSNIGNLIKMNNLKHDILNSIQIIKNDNTIISNIKSLKFKSIDDFVYNEDDSIENKLKNIFKQFKHELNINNLYFGKDIKRNNSKDTTYLKGPYNNLTLNEKETMVTDIKGLKDDKLICVSFDNGKAKIFDSNINENCYPLCLINEFEPQQGIHSLCISNNKNNVWFLNNKNENDIIYLNGYEEIKVIQMNKSYSSYKKLYSFKEEGYHIYSTIEINYNSILTLNHLNTLEIIKIDKKNDQIIDERNEANDILFNPDLSPKSINKISQNILCLNLSNCSDFDLNMMDKDSRPTLNDFKFGDNDSLSDDLNEDISRAKYNSNNEKKNNDYEKFTKIIKLGNEDKNNSNTNKENYGLIIEKEYIFTKSYELLGSISDEDNLLLLNYIKEEGDYEYLLCIFDFNINQYIYSFNLHNIWANPKIFVKMKYDIKIDKQGFVISNEDLEFIQYFYDKNYINKIYYVNTVKAEKKSGKLPSKLLNVDKEVIMITDNNSYYLSKY